MKDKRYVLYLVSQTHPKVQKHWNGLSWVEGKIGIMEFSSRDEADDYIAENWNDGHRYIKPIELKKFNAVK